MYEAETPGGFNILSILFILVIAVIVFIIVMIIRSGKKSRQNFEAYQQQTQHGQEGQPNGYAPLPQFTQDAPSGGFAALGFFFPLVGLILYLVWNTTLPFRARSAGKGALAGVIVYVALSVVITLITLLLLHS